MLPSSLFFRALLPVYFNHRKVALLLVANILLFDSILFKSRKLFHTAARVCTLNDPRLTFPYASTCTSINLVLVLTFPSSSLCALYIIFLLLTFCSRSFLRSTLHLICTHVSVTFDSSAPRIIFPDASPSAALLIMCVLSFYHNTYQLIVLGLRT